MNGMAFLIACALAVGLAALALLFWTIANGQYEDLDGDAQRILIDDPADEASGRF